MEMYFHSFVGTFGGNGSLIANANNENASVDHRGNGVCGLWRGPGARRTVRWPRILVLFANGNDHLHPDGNRIGVGAICVPILRVLCPRCGTVVGIVERLRDMCTMTST